MKKNVFVSAFAILFLLVVFFGCAKQGPVQQYFSNQGYTFPVDVVKPEVTAPALESDSGNYLNSGNDFIKAHTDLAFWKKLMPEAEGFRVFAPYVTPAADSGTYEYAINVSAFGTGELPSSNAIYVQGGEIWRWDNIAQFKPEDSTWAFAGWLN